MLKCERTDRLARRGEKRPSRTACRSCLHIGIHHFREGEQNVPAASVEEVASRILNSGPIQDAISTLRGFTDKHPVIVGRLMLNGLLPLLIRMAAFQVISIANYRNRATDVVAESIQISELSEKIDEMFSYLRPTAKGPRRRKYSSDELNDLLLKCIRDLNMPPLEAHRAVKKVLESPMAPGRAATARYSAALAMELRQNERGITLRQIADRVCPCGERHHKPRCECLRTLRREIQLLNKFIQENNL